MSPIIAPTYHPELTSEEQCRTGQGDTIGLRSLAELRQTFGSGMSRRLGISEQNTEEGSVVERVPEICREIPLNPCQNTCAYLGGNSLKNEIPEISRTIPRFG